MSDLADQCEDYQGAHPDGCSRESLSDYVATDG
jgi:hypothetical protein